MNKLLRRRFGIRGFTLVELMVAISLMGVAGLVIFGVFVSSQSSLVDTQQVLDAQSDTRIVLGMIAQDIRSAGSDLQGVIPGLAVCSNDSVRVMSDLNVNGLIDVGSIPAEDITWVWNSADETLLRATSVETIAIVRNVSAFAINYLDAAGADILPLPLTATDRSRVRAVQVFLTVRLDDGNTRDWNRTVALRNDLSL